MQIATKSLRNGFAATFRHRRLLQTQHTAHLRVVSTAAAAMQVERLPVLSDNYVWLLHEPTSKLTAVVDPALSGPVVDALDARGWKLDFILNTHHHADHTGGNLELKGKYGCHIVGPAADEERIPGIDERVADGDVWRMGAVEFRVFDTPGHTKGHISFWAPAASALFCGDTLFALGCGRLFEGTPQQMWQSLSKLVGLPRETQVYCTHEYTQSNAKFAVTVDPSNPALQQRKQQIDAARSRGQPTVPSTLGEELDTNPFMRPNDPGLRAALGFAEDVPDWQVFAEVRRRKDRF